MEYLVCSFLLALYLVFLFLLVFFAPSDMLLDEFYKEGDLPPEFNKPVYEDDDGMGGDRD